MQTLNLLNMGGNGREGGTKEEGRSKGWWIKKG